MKKTLISVIAPVFVAAALSACGGKAEPAPTTAAKPVETAAKTTEAAKPAETEKAAEVSKAVTKAPEAPAASGKGLKDFSVSFDKPYCFLETDEITMTANSVQVDESDYLLIDTLVENHSDGKTYEVSIPRAAVNGIEIHPTYSEDVEDECTEEIAIDLSRVVLNAKPSDITDIELEVNIEDDDFETVYNGVVHIYPHGENKAFKYQRKAADTDVVLIDSEKFKVSAIGCEYVKGWGYSVHLYAENKMDEPIRLDGEYFKMNDTDVPTWYDGVVGAGDVCFTDVEWSQNDLDEAEIEEVASVSFMLRVYDNEMDNMLYDKEVKLEP